MRKIVPESLYSTSFDPLWLPMFSFEPEHCEEDEDEEEDGHNSDDRNDDDDVNGYPEVSAASLSQWVNDGA